MSKSSGTISLVLLGAASTAFLGYQATRGPLSSYNYQPTSFADGGSDFTQNDGFSPGPTPPSTNPTTDPSNHFTGSGPYYDSEGRPYYHTGTGGFVGYHSSTFTEDNSHSSSGTPGRSSGSGSSSAGTSRGGFGSTGHAVGSASS